MRRNFVIRAVVVLSMIPIACTERAKSRSGSVGTASTTSAEVMDDEYEVPPPRDSVSSVMQAKLAHSQAILEAIVMSDFAQAESNALALRRISQGADWLVQDSPAYFDFSAEFRGICDDLFNHSREKNLRALAQDYANLSNSCVACHEYLRQERQIKDLPGRVSLNGLRPDRDQRAVDGGDS